ncbi:MAG TPA: hypothetical protein DF712_13510 [Balneola sp.]|nr:hypothetical protein [Balneola sp.]
MLLTEKKLRSIIKVILEDNNKSSANLEKDPRYSVDVLMMPFSKKWEHDGEEYPKKTENWAVWEKAPKIAGDRYCWIPGEKISEQYMLPMFDLNKNAFYEFTKLSGKGSFEENKLAVTFKDGIKQLKNTAAWFYGPGYHTPMARHPGGINDDVKGKLMLPPSWSLYYIALEERAKTILAHVSLPKNDRKHKTIEHYAKINGYGKNSKGLKEDMNSVLRDTSISQ